MLKIGMCPNPYEDTEWHRNANPNLFWLAKAIENQGGKIIPLSGNDAQHPMKWKKMGVEVLHLHWPGAFFNFNVARKSIQNVLPQQFVISWASYKLKNWEKDIEQTNIPIVWQVHDILSHHAIGYNAKADKMLHETVFKNSKGLVLNGLSSLDPILQHYGGAKPFANAALGSYRDLYGAPITREEAKKRLGINNTGKVFAYLGTARVNRNPFAAATVFPQVTKEDDLLLVAGINTQYYLPKILDSKIKLFPGMVSKELFREILCASDFVINDGKNYLTSAVLRTAASYHIPSISYAYGCANDFAKDAAIWIDDENGGLEKAIREASLMDKAAWNKLSSAAARNEKLLTWEKAGMECMNLYQQVTGMIE